MTYQEIKNIFNGNGNGQSFESGFETHVFYSAILDNVKSKLHIIGRKNRKLFDKDHHDFFENLPENFDLKIFFLNPKSEYVSNAHADHDFKEQLETCISNARAVLDKYCISQSVIQFYDHERRQAIIEADNLKFVHDIKFVDGTPEPITNNNFRVMQEG